MTDPLGTYTFVFTDIEGSTRLWEAHPADMREAVRLHDGLLKEVFAAQGGRIFKTLGDAFCVAFDAPGPALLAALEAERRLLELGTKPRLSIRVAIHTGTAENRDNDYFGPTLSRVARVMAAGHGGQILVTGATYELIRDDLPRSAELTDLGLHRLRDLIRPEQIYQLSEPGLENHFEPLRTLDSRPNNLPIQSSRFVGRERELQEIHDAVLSSRLVTVVGPGGVGKTRTTLQAAADLEDRFPEGVWLVELAGLTDQSRIAWALASALSVREQEGVPLMETLKANLTDRRVLIVLDNCEHLVSAAAAAVDELLRSSHELRVLASSREPLNLSGERVYRLGSLSVGPPATKLVDAATLEQFEAVQLFIDRALLVTPGFRVDNDNAAAVAGICARLDGIPLAIELAAARLRSLSVQEIHQRLDNTFRLLTSGSRSLSARQQTLRGAIDWSYDLLEDHERVTLQRLSVFSGSWSLQAAEAVVAGDPIESLEVVDLVTSLVDKSLVIVDLQGSESRYRLLGTIRQYAAEKLGGAASAVKDRHLAHYREAAASVAGGGAAAARLYREGEEIRTALAWCMSEPERNWEALAFACDLHRPVLMRWSFSEASGLWETLLERGSDLRPDRVLLNAYGHASWYAGRTLDLDRARYWAEKGVSIADQVDDAMAEGRILNALGSLFFHLEQFEEAEAYTRRSIEVVAANKSYQAEVALYTNLGTYLAAMGRSNEAKEALLKAKSSADAASDPLGQALCARHLGELAIDDLDLEAGARLLETGYEIARGVAMEQYTGSILTHHFGYLPYHMGNPDLARSRLEEGIEIVQRIGAASDEYDARVHLIEICAAQGDLVAAKNHFLRLPKIRDSANKLSELYRSCAWLALRADLPEVAAGLAEAAKSERAKSRHAMGGFEEERGRRLDEALGGRSPTGNDPPDFLVGRTLDALPAT